MRMTGQLCPEAPSLPVTKTGSGSTRAFAIATAFAFLAIVAGCGGGGGGSSTGSTGTTGGTTGGTSSAQSTTFHVDVASGHVTVTTPSAGSSAGALTAHAVFTGSAVTFNSSQLLDQAGGVGLKALSVSVTNNWGLPIGQTAGGATSGFRVLFGGFTNVGAFSDIRSETTVSTFAGSGTAGSADGPLGAATFTGPTGAAVDSSGNVYVADTSTKTIRKISSGFVSTIKTPAALNSPFGIAVNPVDGSLIVTEYHGNTVERMMPDGAINTIAGTGTAGGGNGTGNTATLNGPVGVAVDHNGVIYVAEFSGNRIRKIVLTGADPKVASNYLVSTVAGTGVAGAADGAGAVATFSAPAGIAVDSSGALYVADSVNNKVRRVDAAGNVATIAGTGGNGASDGTGAVATFNAPFGIVAVNNAVIVSDSVGNRIRQLTVRAGGSANPTSATSWQVQSLAGTSSIGATDGPGDVATFNSVRLLGADRSGNLYLPDLNNRKIRELIPNNGIFPIGIATGSVPTEQVQLSNADGEIPNTSISTGAYINYPVAVAPGATSPAQQWNFTIPAGVTAFEFTVTVEANTTALTPPTSTGGAGDPSVNVRTYAGSANHIGYVNGTLVSSRFNGPDFIAIDAAGDLYLGDQYNGAIRRIGANGIVSTVAGTGSPTFADGPGNTAGFSSPSGIAVTPDGNTLFVADVGNQRIRRIIHNGGDITNPQNWYATTIAGTGTAGGNYSVANGDVATLNAPFGLCMDAGGNLFLTEYSGNRVRRIRFKGGDASLAANYSVDLLAGSIAGVAGTTGDTDSNNGLSATLNHPSGIAVDGYGNLYVCDQSNHRIRMVTGDGAVTTLAGGVSGDAPSSGHVDGAGSTARFNSPEGITVDSSNEIFVTDASSNYIRRIGQNGVVSTVAGTGGSGATDGPGNVATFNNPAAIAADPYGNLYVGSVNDNSIRLIQRTITSGTQ